MDKEIGILAINPSQNPFVLPEVTKQIRLLTNGENVLFDIQSAQADFGHVSTAFQRLGEVLSEVEHVRVRVKGLFSMGQTLATTGHIITSDQALGASSPRGQPI
ncbi:MAG: hypothetical protein PHS17_18670 [Desulfobacterales bacterium]|nr:hypothetical protein [Desulfobacterales bacterium]